MCIVLLMCIGAAVIHSSRVWSHRAPFVLSRGRGTPSVRACSRQTPSVLWILELRLIIMSYIVLRSLKTKSSLHLRLEPTSPLHPNLTQSSSIRLSLELPSSLSASNYRALSVHHGFWSRIAPPGAVAAPQHGIAELPTLHIGA